jgi:hypothetical protein
MAYSLQNAVSFSVYGDRVNSAIAKGSIAELEYMFAALNEVQAGVKDIVQPIEYTGDVEPSAGRRGDFAIINKQLFYRTSQGWVKVIQPPVEATPSRPGMAMLGSLDGVRSSEPSDVKIVTQPMLDELATEGLDSAAAGSIVLWSSISIPRGWAVCDGQNGTPDLRARFVRMDDLDYAVGGKNSITLLGDVLLTHEHEYTASLAPLPHEHAGTAVTEELVLIHEHAASASGTRLPDLSIPGAHMPDTSSRFYNGVGPDAGSSPYGRIYSAPVGSFSGPAHEHSAAITNATSATSIVHQHRVSGDTESASLGSLPLTFTTASAEDPLTVDVAIEPPFVQLLYIMKV